MSETACHLIAGGYVYITMSFSPILYSINVLSFRTAGTVGAILTSPLEVIKTRLQSSSYQFLYSQQKQVSISSQEGVGVANFSSTVKARRSIFSQPINCFKDIIKNEGPRGLFKGLTPTLFGVAPTRAIFFFAYQNCKGYFATYFEADISIAQFYALHGLSASLAGFTSLTLTNPVWLVKTRLQLDNQKNSLLGTIRNIYKTTGIRGFYRGIAASYLGIGETVIHIMFYEELKRLFIGFNSDSSFYPVSSTFEMARVLAVSATSKAFATSLMYPHEVLRTRLRQADHKYKSLRQAIPLIWREEGWRAFYRGLGIHIFRQVPNAAITMSVYELVVSLIKPTNPECSEQRGFKSPFKKSSISCDTDVNNDSNKNLPPLIVQTSSNRVTESA